MKDMKKWSLIVAALATLLSPSTTLAAESSDRGLTVTPLRAQTSVGAGESTTGFFTVANFTQEVMKIDLSIEKFTVKSGTYEYEFGTAENSWVQLSSDQQIELRPREERKVGYRVTIPEYAPSGGYYYALLASMDVPGSSISSELRVASLLYMTVDGGALSYESSVSEASFPTVTMSPSLTYSYEAKNTGNVHFAAVDYSRVKGFLADIRVEKGMQILMPKTHKSVSGSAMLPMLPGIYTLEYGLKDEQGNIVSKTASVIYAPFWSLVAMLLLLWGIVAAVRMWRTRRAITIFSRSLRQRYK